MKFYTDWSRCYDTCCGGGSSRWSLLTELDNETYLAAAAAGVVESLYTPTELDREEEYERKGADSTSKRTNGEALVGVAEEGLL